MTKTSILLLGTGFLGGSLLEVLKKNTDYEISATSRQDSHIGKLKELGIKPIKVSLDESETITDLVSRHDVTINTANSDHPESIQATLEGIQKRVDAGKDTIYLHTSGTGVLGDSADGLKPSDLIFQDDNPEHIEANTDDGAIHRQVDLNILRHAKKWHAENGKGKGDTQIRIAVPPLIFGKGSGPFKDISVQIPSLIRASKALKYPVVHGEGKNVTSYVNVLDLADGYALLLESLRKSDEPKLQSPGDIYVFASSDDEFAFRRVCERLGELLHKRGAVESPEPKSIPYGRQVEYGLTMEKKAWNGSKDYQSVGGNARTRAIKLRKLGWNPARTSVDQVLESLERDVDVILKE